MGILCPNTPAFLESIFGIAAAGAVNVAVNYRLKHEDITYILEHADTEAIIVDAEFLPLLDGFRQANPEIPLITDTDTDATEGELSGQFDEAVLEGLQYDLQNNGKGWEGLEAQAGNEEDIIALAYTSGTTAKPKVRTFRSYFFPIWDQGLSHKVQKGPFTPETCFILRVLGLKKQCRL